MTDFLLELLCEEIPARMQAGARADLERLFRAEMEAAGVSHGAITVWSTPRRLALIAEGMPERTEAVSEEAKGPPEGAPDAAIDGFCKKNGVARDQLELREVKGRNTWFAVRNVPGRAVADVLAEAIPSVVRTFPWPKSMRWGDASISTESLRWVRPLQGIVAILGEELVSCEVGGVASGYSTVGHRFHHSGEVTIGGANDYAEKLRACHVVVDQAERQDMIRTRAREVAEAAGLTLVEDEGLVVENAGLTEWPEPLLGRFDEDYLAVPPEVIQLTARVNQKYFVCEDSKGRLANAFVCTANISAADPDVVVDGNRKVLAARLSDARFFWDTDRKVPLEEQARKLERITFHEKLGTLADKVERVAKLARWLAEEGAVPGADPALTGQAALLAKADLVTEMVGEFPELQGLMGGYYARAEGLPDAVADAIRDHYKHAGQGDDIPTAPVTVAVSLADKLDNLFAFFKIDLLPTGSKDPFALRRAGLGVLSLIRENGIRVDLQSVAQAWGSPADGTLGRRVADFLFERLGVQLKDEGIRHDLIQASRSWSLGSETDGRPDRVEQRARALKDFLETEDGANLLAGYKRAANILKKEDYKGADDRIARTGEEDPLALVDDPELGSILAQRGHTNPDHAPEPAEAALIAALDQAAPAAAQAVDSERFEEAMAALASLRGPIDAFFDNVTVNDPDPARREARLALLDRFRAAVHKVADFSRIES